MQSEGKTSSEASAGKSDKWVGRSLRCTPPHPTAPLSCAGPACRRPVPCELRRRTGTRRRRSRRAALLERPSYLEASGEESEDDLWFRGVGNGPEGRRGGGWRDRDVRGEVRTATGARGYGCPARRPSGSAAAAPLGLTTGPEAQRSGGGGGLTILPRGPVPSNRHQPRCGSAGGSSLTFPAGGASAPSPGLGGDDVGKGGREGGRREPRRQQEMRGGGGEGGGAAGAATARVAVRYPRWVPSQCPFLSPIVNITGRLSPWHKRNRTFCPAAPASSAHSLAASNRKPALIGLRPPSISCQQVRLRADPGLVAGGGRRRNRRVRRDEAQDWAQAKGTRMQPRALVALLPLTPGRWVG